MEKSRKTNKLILILLLVLIIGLSIGFAAYGRELKITTSATVKGDEAGFKVVFSTAENAATHGKLEANGCAGEVTIAENSIELSDVKATFTEPGQTATWSFYAFNDGKFDAFLNGVTIGEITATAKNGTDEEKVAEAVKGISVKLSVDSVDYTETKNPLTSTYKLPTNEGIPVVLTMTYAQNSAIADGDFDVSVGDIKLHYSSID